MNTGDTGRASSDLEVPLLVDLARDELVPAVEADRGRAEAAHVGDDVVQLLLREPVSQLLVDVAQLVDAQLRLAVHVQQVEGVVPALLRERAALNKAQFLPTWW